MTSWVTTGDEVVVADVLGRHAVLAGPHPLHRSEHCTSHGFPCYPDGPARTETPVESVLPGHRSSPARRPERDPSRLAVSSRVTTAASSRRPPRDVRTRLGVGPPRPLPCACAWADGTSHRARVARRRSSAGPRRGGGYARSRGRSSHRGAHRPIGGTSRRATATRG